MCEVIRTAVKAPVTKKENPVSQVQKCNFNQPLRSPVEQMLILQKTIRQPGCAQANKVGSTAV